MDGRWCIAGDGGGGTAGGDVEADSEADDGIDPARKNSAIAPLLLLLRPPVLMLRRALLPSQMAEMLHSGEVPLNEDDEAAETAEVSRLMDVGFPVASGDDIT